MKSIGARIKQRREDLKMSQGELAQKLGYRTRSSIARIEGGYNNLNQPKLVAFAEVLGVTPAWLLDGDSVDNVNADNKQIQTQAPSSEYWNSILNTMQKQLDIMKERVEQNNGFFNVLFHDDPEMLSIVKTFDTKGKFSMGTKVCELSDSEINILKITLKKFIEDAIARGQSKVHVAAPKEKGGDT